MTTNSFAFFKGLGEFPTVMQTFRILPTPLGFISGYAKTKMFSIALMWKVEHTSGKTFPTLFDQKYGFFFVLFDLTNERRIKETKATV